MEVRRILGSFGHPGPQTRLSSRTWVKSCPAFFESSQSSRYSVAVSLDRTAGHRHPAFGVVDRQLIQDEGFEFLVALLLVCTCSSGCSSAWALAWSIMFSTSWFNRAACRPISWKSWRVSAGLVLDVLPSAVAVDFLMASRGVCR